MSCYGSDLVQMFVWYGGCWFSCGAAVVQLRVACSFGAVLVKFVVTRESMVQRWFSYGAVLVHSWRRCQSLDVIWLSCGSALVQLCAA